MAVRLALLALFSLCGIRALPVADAPPSAEAALAAAAEQLRAQVRALLLSAPEPGDGDAPSRGRRAQDEPYPVGPSTGEFLNTNASTWVGPAAPLLVLSAPSKEVFDTAPFLVPTPDATVLVPVPVIPGCKLAVANSTCPATLSVCLARDISSSSAICSCYNDHGKCWRAQGCIEVLPRKDINYCFTTMRCPQPYCVGNGAAAYALPASAAAACLLAVLALAWGG